jgi:hypothetical protein
MRYWVHVRPDINEARKKRLAPGDRVAFYAPHPEQRFSAIGEVRDGGAVDMLPAAGPPIQALIDSLDFIRDKHQWGWVFRRGFFEISEADFRRIAGAVSAESSLPGAVR